MLLSRRIYLAEVVFFVFFDVNRTAFTIASHSVRGTAPGSPLQATCESHVLGTSKIRTNRSLQSWVSFFRQVYNCHCLYKKSQYYI